MNDENVVLSIIVNAIQFETQHSSGHDGSEAAKNDLDLDATRRIARTILAALAEQGFQVTRTPSEPR
jgi:hypothetical protein